MIFFWTYAGDLEVELVEAGSNVNLETVAPKNRIPASGLSRAFFEMFLGSSAVVPAAIPKWVAGAKELLESENVKRDSRKAGSG